jgi:hypothetical protein
MKIPDTIAAHEYSIRHETQLRESDLCGCFYCLHIFLPGEIEEWIDEPDTTERTALCPDCLIDSVIGSQSGFPITPEFLEKMQKQWF